MQRQSTKIEILPCLPTTQPIITVQPFRMPAPPLPSPPGPAAAAAAGGDVCVGTSTLRHFLEGLMEGAGLAGLQLGQPCLTAPPL
jgi:hypothetical protein